MRRRLFPKVRVTIEPPVKLEVDPALKGKKRRLAAGQALYKIMSDLFFKTGALDRTVVGALIEAFSREAVRLMWKHGGVFDKLVGDCVIGLFGPPFSEQDGPTRALACARAAAEISRFAREELARHPATAKVVAAGEPLGVAIGINDCPASVGLFGPNHDFTAFSPGMNNTARLQSVAVRDEVLVLAPMRALIAEACPSARFGELRHERVKNVAEPLAFYALDAASVLRD